MELSNNHAMDYQGSALLETIRHLDEHGIAHAGTAGNLEEAAQFALLEARGMKVLVPVLISNAQVNTAHGAVTDEMHKRVAELSAAMGTEVRREGDHLVIDVIE